MGKLCISTNLSSAELAAWVQAIGTIVAISAAIGIAWWQNHSDRARRDREASEATRRAARICVVFGVKLLESLGEMVHVLGIQAEDRIYVRKALIADLAKWPDAFDIDRLPTDAVHAFLTIRTVATEADALGRLMSTAGAVNFQHWERQYESLRARLSKQSLLLHAALGDPLAKEALDAELNRGS